MRLFTFVLMTALSANAFGQTNRSSSLSSLSSNGDGVCLTDARWANGNRSLDYSRQAHRCRYPLLSKGNACANTEIRVTATFLNQANESICSGVIPYAMTLSAELQIFNLEIRPLTQQDFLRWRNEPGIRGLQQGKPLKCFNVDRDMERARASSVYLSVAVLPPQTGLAVLDAIIRLNP